MNIAARAVLLVATAALIACPQPEVEVVDPEYFVLRAEDSPQKEKILDLRDLDLREAELTESSGPGEWAIVVGVKQPGAGRLQRWSIANINKRAGVYVDGHLVSSPIIVGEISDGFVLQGGFTKDEAEEILEGLRRGGAPAAQR